MTLPHYMTLITRTDLSTQMHIAACTNSYVAVAFLQAMAQEKSMPLTVVSTNRLYRIGDAEYSFTEARLIDMAWVKRHEEDQ